MKPMYWRPQKASSSTMLFLGLFSLLACATVEVIPSRQLPGLTAAKTRATELAEQGRRAIRARRELDGLTIDGRLDPKRTGLIGCAMSSVTSKPADLATKQLSVHPLFASAAVQLLADAGVKQGDAIAVGWTGSFPGLNLALCAAIEAMELRPIIVASVMASQYGANEPTYAWLDMERTLYEAGLIGFRSGAATIGGPADRGWGMPAESLLSARTAMDRNQITPLHADDLAGSIEARMEYYRRHTDGQQVAVYVNVGGGRASAGGAAGKSLFQAGLNLTSKKTADGLADCVMGRFLAAGTPVIHLAQVADLAKQFGLSATEQSWQSPPDSVVAARAPSRFAACLALLVILAVLRAFILTDIGRQFLGELMHKTTGQFRPSLRILRSASGPELMV